MSDVNYMAELEEWIEDYKIGLVEPPEPIAFELYEEDMAIYIKVGTAPRRMIVSVLKTAKNDSMYLLVIYTVLRVDLWLASKREGKS